jgi:hypothetical protein
MLVSFDGPVAEADAEELRAVYSIADDPGTQFRVEWHRADGKLGRQEGGSPATVAFLDRRRNSVERRRRVTSPSARHTGRRGMRVRVSASSAAGTATPTPRSRRAHRRRAPRRAARRRLPGRPSIAGRISSTCVRERQQMRGSCGERRQLRDREEHAGQQQHRRQHERL